jgi:hypothetical protein
VKKPRDVFERVGDSPKINVWLFMTCWKIYDPFCYLSLCLSAEATVTGPIYLGRAVGVCMTALSFGGNYSAVILQQMHLFFIK